MPDPWEMYSEEEQGPWSGFEEEAPVAVAPAVDPNAPPSITVPGVRSPEVNRWLEDQAALLPKRTPRGTLELQMGLERLLHPISSAYEAIAPALEALEKPVSVIRGMNPMTVLPETAQTIGKIAGVVPPEQISPTEAARETLTEIGGRAGEIFAPTPELKPAARAAGEMAAAVVDPEFLPLIGAGVLARTVPEAVKAVKPLESVVGAAFGADIGSQIPSQVLESMNPNLTPEERQAALARAVLGGALVAGIAHHGRSRERTPDAIQEREAAAVPVGETPGNRPQVGAQVREQAQKVTPETPQGEVLLNRINEQISNLEQDPAATGTMPDIVPVDTIKRTQLDQLIEIREAVHNPVVSEHQTLIERVAPEFGERPVIVVEGESFPSGARATTGPNGEIIINRREVDPYLKKRAEGEREGLLRSIIGEEWIHSFDDPSLRGQYWDSLTKAEQAIFRKSYTGSWKGKPANRPQGFTNEQLGAEAYRRHVQDIMDMKPTEILEAKGLNWLNESFLNLAQQSIFKARKALGTDASKFQVKLLDDFQSRVDAGRKKLGLPVTAHPEDPFSFTKEEDKPKFTPGQVDKMSVEEFRSSMNDIPDGLTGEAYRLGRSTTTIDGLQEIAGLRDKYSAEAKAAMKAQDFDTAMSNSYRSQFYREAYEASTGTGSAGNWLRKKDPNYQPPLPEGKEPQAVSAPESFRKEKGQEELPLLAAAKGEARPGAAEMGAQVPEPITPAKIREAAAAHISTANKPSFRSFMGDVEKQFGGMVKPGQVREMWEDAIWKQLMEMPGAELAKLRDKVGLRESLGGGELVNPPAPSKGFSLEQEVEGETPRETRKRVQSEIAESRTGEFSEPMRRRYSAIGRIAQKLIGQAEAAPARLRRATVEPEDIGWWREKEGQEPAYRPISPSEAKSPNLGEVLTSGGSMDRTGKKAPPESVTKRVTALIDKNTGKVELVSTYRTSAGKTYIVDPRKYTSYRPHVPLEMLMKDGRYQPIASVLLDEPVQQFRQTFKDLNEFRNKFSDKANQELASRRASAAEAAALPEEGIEPPAAYRTGEPITDSELKRLYDFFGGDTNPSIEDVQSSFESLLEENRPRDATTGQPLPLDPKQAAVVDALIKAHDAEMKANKDLNEMAALNNVLETIYESSTGENTRQTFIQRLLAKYGEKAPERPEGSKAAAPATGARELTMIDRLPPTVTRGETLPKGAGPKAFMSEPESFTKDISDKVESVKDKFRAWAVRKPVKVDIAQLRDAATTDAAIEGQQAQRSILERIASPIEDAAVIVKRQARGNFGKLAEFRQKVIDGLKNAAGNRKAIKAGKELMEAIDYAEKNWDKPSLNAAALEFQKRSNAIFAAEKANGAELTYEKGYVPQRYDAETFNDHAIEFGEQAALGRQYKKARVFPDYFEAYREGYIPKNFKASAVLGSRVKDGMSSILRRQWLEGWKEVMDPATNEPIMRDMVMTQRVDPSTGKVTNVDYKVPDPNYVRLQLSTGSPVAVRKGYARLFDALTARSQIAESAPVQALQYGAAYLKHRLLLLDTFHVGRMMAMGSSILGKKMGWNKGNSILEYSPQDMVLAYENGAVPRETIEWALDIDPDNVVRDSQGNINFSATPKLGKNFIEVNDIGLGIGAKERWTRQQALRYLTKNGLNVGRIQDALYRDMIKEIPVLGGFSKWVFDKLSRGVMSEAALHEFERLNAAKPNMSPQEIARFVARDTNIFFGNLGRQGVFKNPSLRAILQIVFLAPQWVESLIQKESRTLARVATAPFKGSDQIKFGPIGKGMGAGIAAMIVATQIANLITTGKTTFQNEDKEHLLDAWIPDITGKTKGFYLSPLSLHAEVAHDIWRYSHGKDQFADAMNQIAENKLGPIARGTLVYFSGHDPLKGKLTSTWSRAKSAALAAAPVPIGVSPLLKQAGSMAGITSPPQPGAVQRQALSSLGIKTEPVKTAVQQIGKLAAQHMEAAGKKAPIEIMATEDPSYSKLRTALKNDDVKEARAIMDELLKTKKPKAIKDAMKLAKDRPFTGSKEEEKKFRDSLTDSQLKTYDEAKEEKRKLYEKFLDEVWFK